MKLLFLIAVELPTDPGPERTEVLRDEIEQHAAAVVPFFTHQQDALATCAVVNPTKEATCGR